ncbi:MAG: response regulator [Proteobacteria bacterium]|nr:response regulator [Pseudomonadota bacterium]MBU4470351.1 response regulator [Pseudomonadota bacterium]MCG2752762.1 response regulator [Desulfobacteraceae bacterium]
MSSISASQNTVQPIQNALMPVKSGAERVLLVDDDHTAVLVACRMLESLGFMVHAVNSGAAAKDCISKYRYDLLVSGLQMPNIDGYTLSKQIKDASQDTKVIIMTGLGCADVAGYMNTGIIDGWLFKPFSLSELSGTMRKCKFIETPNISSISRSNRHYSDDQPGLHLGQNKANELNL